MQAVTTVGLDIAKSVFQIHGVDAAGNVIVRRQLKRRYVLPFFQKLIRAHLAEFGIVAPVGRNGVEQLLDVAADASDKRLPDLARACVVVKRKCCERHQFDAPDPQRTSTLLSGCKMPVERN
jgi:hypothetical protein